MEKKKDNMDFEFIYFLRRYIDIAVRYQISPATLMVFEFDYYKNARSAWEKFKNDFRTKKRSLSKIEKGNLYDELKQEFYPMIEQYFDFYSSNIAAINQAVSKSNYTIQVNPYSVLFELCKDTKREIEVLPTKEERAKISFIERAKILLWIPAVYYCLEILKTICHFSPLLKSLILALLHILRLR